MTDQAPYRLDSYWKNKDTLELMVIWGAQIVHTSEAVKRFHPESIETFLKGIDLDRFPGFRNYMEDLGKKLRELLTRGPPVKAPKATQEASKLLLLKDEPWEGSVDGAELLEEIVNILDCYMQLPQHTAIGIALWALHTYVFDVFDITPRLLISSPRKRCGKSRLMMLLDGIVRQAISVDNLSLPAFFRIIDKHHPTLLLDEFDSFSKKKDNVEIVGGLNSGFMRGRTYLRCEGDNHEVRQFDVFAPAAIAMIGLPISTTLDRCILVRMDRKKKEDGLPRLGIAKVRSQLEHIRQKGLKWAIDHREELAELQPDEVPGELDDRAVDFWEPLLAIADLAGVGWPEAARKAAKEISGGRDEAGEEGDVELQLLKDIRTIFQARGEDRIASVALVEALHRVEERPWAEWGRTRGPISPVSVARILARYGIRSKTLRLPVGRAKGYCIEDFRDTFDRYLSEAPPFAGIPNVTSVTSLPDNELGGTQNVTSGDAVTDEISPKSRVGNDVTPVTDRNRGLGGADVVEPQ